MNKILQFPPKNQKTPTQNYLVRPILTKEQIFNHAQDDIKSMWDQYEAKNKLNNFIISRIPLPMVNVNADYTSDLNTISDIEVKLGIAVQLNFPQHVIRPETDYCAGFVHKAELFMGDNFKSEARARIMNVLLFIEFMCRLNLQEKEIADSLKLVSSKQKRGKTIEVEDSEPV